MAATKLNTRFPLWKKAAFQRGAAFDVPRAEMQQQCPQTSLGSHAHFPLAVELPEQPRGSSACPGLAACPQRWRQLRRMQELPRLQSLCLGAPGNTCCSTQTAEGITSPICSRIRNEAGLLVFFFSASPSALPYLWNQPCPGLSLINSNGKITFRVTGKAELHATIF